MRTITFNEFAQIINDAYAVVLDYESLSYPYVESYEEDNGETFYDYVQVNYGSDYEQVEHSFYSDDCDNITIQDDGSIKFDANDESYAIQVLTIKKIA